MKRRLDSVHQTGGRGDRRERSQRGPVGPHPFHLSGQGRVGFVARQDCVACAAAVLTQDGHGNRAYDVTGPAALTSVLLAPAPSLNRPPAAPFPRQPTKSPAINIG